MQDIKRCIVNKSKQHFENQNKQKNCKCLQNKDSITILKIGIT